MVSYFEIAGVGEPIHSSLQCGPIVPNAAALQNSGTATAELKGFIGQALKFFVSFGGQRSIQRILDAAVLRQRSVVS